MRKKTPKKLKDEVKELNKNTNKLNMKIMLEEENKLNILKSEL